MALVSTDGWEAILRDASIRWTIHGNESTFLGDASIETQENEGVLFGIRCFGQRVEWKHQADGDDDKIVGDNLFSLWIPFPTTCNALWNVFKPLKVRGKTTRAVCHRIHFPPSQSGLESIQVTVQVFDRDTTPSDYFDAALHFANLETYAESVGKGAWYKRHKKFCECKLCIRQALASTN